MESSVNILETLGTYFTQMISWVADVFKVIAGNELALFLVCIPVGFTIVRFAKYILGI